MSSQLMEIPRLPQVASATVEKVMIQGDLGPLQPQERVAYYAALCNSLGLNPLTRPFEYLNFQGKLQLYALKSCTEQLRQMHNVSIVIVSREVVDGCFVVTARASMPNGRQDESIGAVNIEGLKGEARSNAMMKAETKAKRRVTLSICGLAYLDETEAESVRGASHIPVNHDTGEIAEPAPAETLTEDIKANPPHSKSTTPFNALKAFSEMKKRFQSLHLESEYYVILKRHGVEKSNQFPATKEGITAARGCYKELSLAIQELEYQYRQIPEVDVLSDPVELTAGTTCRWKGDVYQVADNGESQVWSKLS